MTDIDPAEIERYRAALHADTDGKLPFDDETTARIAAQVVRDHGFSKEVALASFESRAADIAAVWPETL